MGVWDDPRTWRQPRRGGPTYEEWVLYLRFAPRNVLADRPPANPFKPSPRPSDLWMTLYKQSQVTKWSRACRSRWSLDPVQLAVSGAVGAVLDSEKLRLNVGVISFTRVVVFNIFTTFLLPLCSLSFATEALGREREQRNLLWALTRPLPRWAIYLGKWVAVLPWCLALNVGGFLAVCLAGGDSGRLAFVTYWPAMVLGTLAFAALFHLMGAVFRRPAVLAILYSFFLETVIGNLPGHLKRASISFYMRSWMYDSANAFQLQPDRPLLYSPVSGLAAVVVLAGLTVALLAAGSWFFSPHGISRSCVVGERRLFLRAKTEVMGRELHKGEASGWRMQDLMRLARRRFTRHFPVQNRPEDPVKQIIQQRRPAIMPSSSKASRNVTASNSGGSPFKAMPWAVRRCVRQASTWWWQRLRLGARAGRAWARARLARRTRKAATPSWLTAVTANQPGSGLTRSHLVANPKTGTSLLSSQSRSSAVV